MCVSAIKQDYFFFKGNYNRHLKQHLRFLCVRRNQWWRKKNLVFLASLTFQSHKKLDFLLFHHQLKRIWYTKLSIVHAIHLFPKFIFAINVLSDSSFPNMWRDKKSSCEWFAHSTTKTYVFSLNLLFIFALIKIGIGALIIRLLF